VINSRIKTAGRARKPVRYRRRICADCKKRFSTYEIVANHSEVALLMDIQDHIAAYIDWISNK
jgi:transcriptional regulator NrdR family protein